MLDHIQEASRFIRDHGVIAPEVGVILGTGLGNHFEDLSWTALQPLTPKWRLTVIS
jgi:purine nucleoside phosphorylase